MHSKVFGSSKIFDCRNWDSNAGSSKALFITDNLAFNLVGSWPDWAKYSTASLYKRLFELPIPTPTSICLFEDLKSFSLKNWANFWKSSFWSIGSVYAVLSLVRYLAQAIANKFSSVLTSELLPALKKTESPKFAVANFSKYAFALVYISFVSAISLPC